MGLHRGSGGQDPDGLCADALRVLGRGKHGSPGLSRPWYVPTGYPFSLAPVLLTAASTETRPSHGHGNACVAGVALCTWAEPRPALSHTYLLFHGGWQ